MKRIQFIIILLLCILLTGCVNKETKEVIDSIDALGQITLESFRDLQEVNIKYNLLSEEDKLAVSNIDILEAANTKYNQLKYDYLIERIDNACENITADSLAELEDLLEEYGRLSEDGKKKIVNYKKLEKAIANSTTQLADEMTHKILDYANGSIRNAEYYLSIYKDIMTDEQIKNCLIEIGRFGAATKAEEYLANYLKNPHSYIRYSGSVGYPYQQDNGSFKVHVCLNYGAENSFGASVRDDVEMYVYFTIDTRSACVLYTATELTPRYAWIFASS